MSYILDALRRAESERERERGQVPGLNAQPVPAALGETDKGRPALGRRNLVGAAAALVVLAAGGWWWSRPAPESVRVAAGVPGDAARATEGAPAAPAPAPAQTLPVSPPVPATAPGPALLVAPPAPAPAPALAPAPAPAPAPRTTGPPSKPLREPAATVVSPPATPVTAVAPNAVATRPAAGASAAAARATLLSELSSAQRAELPPMAIGGAIYSDQASSRFVVINGQVVREGETAAPGVVLERIAPKSAVIRWREMRIELPI